jgi:hypothetical protein
MAEPNDLREAAGSPDVRSADNGVYQAAYELKFNLARMEAYHSSEAAFYWFLTMAVYAMSILMGTSAVATALSSFAAPLLIGSSLISAILTALDYTIDFKERAKSHREKKFQYSTWRRELEKHGDDSEWIRRTDHTMQHEWDESESSIRWAVEAL